MGYFWLLQHLLTYKKKINNLPLEQHEDRDRVFKKKLAFHPLVIEYLTMKHMWLVKT